MDIVLDIDLNKFIASFIDYVKETIYDKSLMII